ncbi:MAG: undecaprenyldiphospho-muramoylpentapeptide beta-N-acetylglucosaminyltransferase [Patescibacteria group bacterium]|nr:undecaprenyldiphospho-muramoylpentapeptide beta-N-acetylglucosaminyltransferase [Patescibacteria group bacterium]
MKVLCAGGGTGGHTLPVLAIIKAIERENKDAKILFVGSRFGIESRLVPKMGIKYYGVSTGKFRRYHSRKIMNVIDITTLFKNGADFFRFVRGIFEARSIISHENPDIVFAKGGYVSLPVALAAKSLKVPVVSHESDVVMGMANRRIASFAKTVCVAFPVKHYKEQVDDTKLVETGNPIREDILMGKRELFLSEIGFKKDKKTLLVIGGSQGSRFINDLINEKIEQIARTYQIIWITGERDADLVEYRLDELKEDIRKNIKVYGFVTSELADVYAAADLVVSRAGSNVLFELAALSKPAILIPFDVAAGSHQLENAKLFSRSGAAYLFRQSNLTAEGLFHQIKYLFENEEELQAMAKKMGEWADLGASGKVAKIIIKAGEEKIEESRKAKTK